MGNKEVLVVTELGSQFCSQAQHYATNLPAVNVRPVLHALQLLPPFTYIPLTLHP
jgi:hypothetical protein